VIKSEPISFVLPLLKYDALGSKTVSSLLSVFAHSEVIIVVPPEVEVSIAYANSTVIHQVPNGVYAAYNLGLHSARGSWVSFLGSGDRFISGANKIVNKRIADSKESEFISFRSAWVKTFGLLPKVSKVRQDDPWGPGILATGMPFSHQSIFTRRESLIEMGGFSEKFKISSDFEFLCRSYLAGLKAKSFSEVISLVDPTGISSSDPHLIISEHIEIITSQFPGLTSNDAELLLRWSRGWGAKPDIQLKNKKLSSVIHDIEEKLSQTRKPSNGLRIGARHFTLP